MTTIITLDNASFDINNLFNFNYDILKQLMGAMAKNQSQNTNKIMELEMSMTKKDVKLKK